MKFEKITDLKNCEEVKQLYHASFPPEEQVDFEKLFSGVFEGYNLYAVYNPDGVFVALIHFKKLENFVHINYLAVKKEHQNKGYGSATLTFVKKLYDNKPLVLDIEEIDDSAANSFDRIRRVNFYKKNGFKEGIYKFLWQGVLMTYMNTESIDAEEFMKYIQIVFPTIKDVRFK